MATAVDYSGLAKGMRVQAESGGVYYSAEVVTVSDSKKRAKAPIKVHYLGYTAQEDEWVGASRLRSKALKVAETKKAEKRQPRYKSKFPKPWPTAKEGKKKVLIICSHPNTGKSTNHKLVETAKTTLEADGNAVIVVDLIKIRWNPVATRRDFLPSKQKNPDSFDLQGEQGFAADGEGGFAPDLLEQLQLVDWCDIVIHHFPIYWWSVPAIHKGWIDRCLVWHYSYPPHKSKWTKKQWMVAVTVGPPIEAATRPGTSEAPGAGVPYQQLLSHVALGTPMMCGMEPVPMWMGGGAWPHPDEKKAVLQSEYAEHLKKFVCSPKDQWCDGNGFSKHELSVSVCMQKTVPAHEIPTRPEENLGIMFAK